jgi:hypothetical protein
MVKYGVRVVKYGVRVKTSACPSILSCFAFHLFTRARSADAITAAI